MQLTKLFTTCFLTACLSTIVLACGGDDGGTETTDPTAGDGDGDATGTSDTGPSTDIDCATFCVGYIELCLANGLSDEFPTNDACMTACEAWDQAGKNCRYEQIPAACDQAGNAGTTCN